MHKPPMHIGAVQADGPTPQEMAEATDRAVFEMMTSLRGQHPGLGGAVLAGAASGLARYQLQGLPDGSRGQQVLETLAPIIRQVGDQIAAALRKAKGLPPPREVPVSPMKTAHDKLTAALMAAPFPSYAIWSGEQLLLISAVVTTEGVLTHGSFANVDASLKDPIAVLQAHIIAAGRTWWPETPEEETDDRPH